MSSLSPISLPHLSSFDPLIHHGPLWQVASRVSRLVIEVFQAIGSLFIEGISSFVIRIVDFFSESTDTDSEMDSALEEVNDNLADSMVTQESFNEPLSTTSQASTPEPLMDSFRLDRELGAIMEEDRQAPSTSEPFQTIEALLPRMEGMGSEARASLNQAIEAIPESERTETIALTLSLIHDQMHISEIERLITSIAECGEDKQHVVACARRYITPNMSSSGQAAVVIDILAEMEASQREPLIELALRILPNPRNAEFLDELTNFPVENQMILLRQMDSFISNQQINSRATICLLRSLMAINDAEERGEVIRLTQLIIAHIQPRQRSRHKFVTGLSRIPRNQQEGVVHRLLLCITSEMSPDEICLNMRTLACQPIHAGENRS